MSEVDPRLIMVMIGWMGMAAQALAVRGVGLKSHLTM
jgi:hypothetical protein